MLRVVLAITCSVLPAAVPAQEQESAISRYAELEAPTATGGLDWTEVDAGWEDRVAAEFEIINDADLASLRAALADERLHVRAMAARALGILGDEASAGRLAELAQHDPEFVVRIRAVESLGLLKTNLEVIEAVREDDHGGVSWAADLAEVQFHSELDLAAQIRRAFEGGIERDQMGIANVGERAPDFTALTLEGELFELSSVIGTKPIAIYFAAFDQ